MRARLIDASNQEADAVGSFAVVLGVGLRAVADGGNEALERDGAAVRQARGQRLLLHEVGEDAGVGCEAGEREAEVLVDSDDFLLVGGELFCVSLGDITMLVMILILDLRDFGYGEVERKEREVPLMQRALRVSCSLFLLPHSPA